MSVVCWIIVVNWERFQHPDALRGEGVPPWLRVYTKLSHNPDFEQLTDAERGILLAIWIEFASSDGQLTATRLSKACHSRVRACTLERLTDAGFITLSASRPLATSKQRASLEESREEEVPKGQAVKGLVGSTSTQDRNGLPEEPHYSLGLEIEVAQIMAGTTDQDEGSEQIVRRYAEQLPLGAIAKVRESAHGKHVRYAVAALKDELKERGKL